MSCQLGFEFTEFVSVESKDITISDKIAKAIIEWFPSATSFTQVYNNQCNYYKLSELFVEIQGHPRWEFSLYSFSSLDDAVRRLVRSGIEEQDSVFSLVDSTIRAIAALNPQQLSSSLTGYENKKRVKEFRIRFQKVNAFKNRLECYLLLNDIKTYIERFRLSAVKPIYDDIVQKQKLRTQ
ncbi:hypothetical protein ACTFQF_00410 [Aliivibrio fischeri]|uniref:hypothetical protein n=1 Tax=Aliivibrio fischeri TaxID=668 RepID=UPI0007C49A8C|nr:hypothetical protein [Aliivibrio fischeri]